MERINNMNDNGIYTLSVILNLHQEGELAKKSIINLHEMTEYARNQAPSWSDIEVIAVLDTPDNATLAVINQFTNYFARVEIVKYGDPAPSRNHGISVAHNNFIVFFDGDDYCSIESLFSIYTTCYKHYHKIVQNLAQFNLLNDDKQIAVFPQKCVEFPNVWVQKYVDSNDGIKSNMMFAHLYVSRICCPRKILIENQWQNNTPPYGYEDWDLNNRLLAAGIEFKIAEEFILFYRTNNEKSLLSRHLANKCVVRYSKLYTQDIKLPANNCAYKDQFDLCLFRVNKFTRYLRYPIKILKSLLRKVVVAAINKWPNLLPQYKKYLDFLYMKGERDLVIKSVSESDRFWFRQHISNEVNCFSQLTDFLKGANTVLFISSTKASATNNISALLQRLKQDGQKIKIVVTSLYNDHYIFSGYECFNISRGNYLWQSLSEITLLHVILKSIIVSNIKSLYIVNSVPLLQIAEYYSSILKEFNIEII